MEKYCPVSRLITSTGAKVASLLSLSSLSRSLAWTRVIGAAFVKLSEVDLFLF